MNKDEMFALKALAWVPTTAICWIYAAHGYSGTPKFDMWFWGISFWLDVVVLAWAVTSLALGYYR